MFGPNDRRLALWLATLSLACAAAACAAPPAGGRGLQAGALGGAASLALAAAPGAADAASATILLEDAAALRFEPLFDGAVRTDSLQSVAAASGAAVAFDTLDGEVWLARRGSSVRVAERAQLGCLAADATGSLMLATLERAADTPVTELVVRRFDATTLEVLDAPWRPSQPALWPEPGARCAFVPGGEADAPWAVVTRARAASAGSALDLWFAPVGERAAQPFSVGARVPAVVDSVAFDSGALLVTETIVDDLDAGRTHAWGLLHVDGSGARTPLPSGAPLSSPLAVALEERTAVVSWIEPGRRVPADFMRPPHATVLSRIVPLSLEVEALDEASVWRTDVYNPIARDHAARPLFAAGRWWVLLVPEPHSLRGKTEPAPYRERLVALDEGSATVRLLPEDIHAARLAADLGLVALGPPDEANPGFSTGVLAATGPLEVAGLEIE